jgi:hypothetical protein
VSIKLRDYQSKAINKMHNGCILNGGVGSGKSMTSLAYYLKICGGDFDLKKKMTKPMPLFIITTARKRDQKEWEKDLAPFGFKTIIFIDSWNNIKKYVKVKNSFFIFDEQRVIGSGTWVKAFLKITKQNLWVLLTATAGDTWNDYIPVFLANNFYRNRTEFMIQHVVFSRFSKFPKVDHYVEISRLVKHRESVMVTMHYNKKTISHNNMLKVGFNKEDFETVLKKRWNIYEKKPIQNVAELCYLLRKVVNSDMRRIYTIEQLLLKHPKVIIFYNFNYERDLLLAMGKRNNIPTTEWNGHNHEQIPNTSNWVYIVQYAAGAEGWNCIETDTIIFYSQNYSYKAITQAAGRIDRLNTPFIDLNYYHLYSMSAIDLAIKKAFDGKKDFNEKRFIG